MFDYLVRDNGGDALQSGEKVYSYKQLLQWSELYSGLICERGKTTKVDKVLFYAKASEQMIFCVYGALRAAATVIPVDVSAAQRETVYIINDARPQLIFCEAGDKQKVLEMLSLIEDEGYKPQIITENDVDAEKLDSMPAEPIPTQDAQEVLTIIYTSGTTGSPKGVMLTYENLWYNVNAVVNDVPIFNPSTRALIILPLHHIFAFAGALIAPMYAGSKSYLLEELTPESIIETLQRGRISLMLGVPRLYESFAKGIMGKINASPVARLLYKICSITQNRSLSKFIFKAVHDKFGGQMEYFVSGGAALPLEVGRIFKNLGFYILEGYGMTECAPMIAFTRPGEWIVGSNGRMLPGCEHRIEPSGELLVRGKNVMKGYYNREAETAEILRGGWLHTGDTVSYDEKEGLRITGRLKEIIVTSNGKNINPAEIENEITQASTAIKEIAILLNENQLQALVYPNLAAPQISSLEEMVRSEIEAYNKEASSYKRIMRYQIISQELPKTRLGKIQRFKLSDLMQARENAPREDISSRSEVFRMLKSFIDEQTGTYANGDSHFEIDLALDSLARISLLSFIEQSFGVKLEEAQLLGLSNLNLLSEYVEEHLDKIAEQDVSFDLRTILTQGATEIDLPRSSAWHWLMHTFLCVFFWVFYRFRVSGKENLPTSPVLYVANHRSGFDGAFVTAKLGWRNARRTMFFAKDKHFNSPWRRYLARRSNVILMNQNTNLRESMQQMYRVLKDGYSVIIFPEGTRSKTGEMGDFKESFAVLSELSGAGVVAVAINGSENATSAKNRMPQFGARINLDFLPPTSIQEGETSEAFAARIKESIAQALSQADS